MKNKLVSIFKTQEQEENFSKIAEKHRYSDKRLTWQDEEITTGEIILSSIFETKEQEENFSKISEKNRNKVKKLTWNEK